MENLRNWKVFWWRIWELKKKNNAIIW